MLVETDSEYYHTKSLEVWNRDCLKERLATDLGFTVARISDKGWNPSIIFDTLAGIRHYSDALKNKHYEMIVKRLRDQAQPMSPLIKRSRYNSGSSNTP
jgi:hypothetical protein